MLRPNSDEDVLRLVCLEGSTQRVNQGLKNACAVTLVCMSGGNMSALGTSSSTSGKDVGVQRGSGSKDTNSGRIPSYVAKAMADCGLHCSENSGRTLEAVHRFLEGSWNYKLAPGQKHGGRPSSLSSLRDNSLYSKLLDHANVTPTMRLPTIHQKHTESISRVLKHAEGSIRQKLGLKQMTLATRPKEMIVCQLARLVEICQQFQDASKSVKGTSDRLRDWEKSFQELVESEVERNANSTKTTICSRERWMKRLSRRILKVLATSVKKNGGKKSAGRLIRFVCDKSSVFPNVKGSAPPPTDSHTQQTALTQKASRPIDGEGTMGDVNEYAARRLHELGLANPLFKSSSAQGALLRFFKHDFKGQLDPKIRGQRVGYWHSANDCPVWQPILQRAKLGSPYDELTNPKLLAAKFLETEDLLRDEWKLAKFERGGPLKSELNFAICHLAGLWELCEDEFDLTETRVRLLSGWKKEVIRTLCPVKDQGDTSLRRVFDLIEKLRVANDLDVILADLILLSKLKRETGTIVAQIVTPADEKSIEEESIEDQQGPMEEQ